MTLHVLDQLPLWVEGDLNAADLATVEGHLAECTACHAAAERLRTTQTWLREALASPFDASDGVALRRSVMKQIRVEAATKPIRRLAIRRGLLAACAASLLIATLIWRRERPTVAPAPGIPAPTSALNPVAEPTLAASQRPAHHDSARILPPPTRPRTAVLPADSPPEAPARIEFQTADPNIRIIWLARATPLPEAEPTRPEEP